MQILKRIMAGVLGFAAFVIVNGCATHSLWTESSFHEPSTPNRLVLFDAPQRRDVLVQYDELSPWHELPRRRAYFLCENLSRTQLGKKPKFVTLSSTNALSTIPLCDESTVPTNVLEFSTVYARSSTKRSCFIVVRKNQQSQGPFELPTYRCSTTDIKRVLLTPLAVALDATIIGGGCFFMAAAHANGGIYPGK